MKRQREETIKLLERIVSLETIPKDVLHHILMTNGLNVRDINALCNSSKILKEHCKSEELWEKIYLKYVLNANVATWRNSKGVAPNPFLRFMAFYATHEEYEYRFESPTGNVALIFWDTGKIGIRYKMPPGYEDLWKSWWMRFNDRHELRNSDSEDSAEENAQIAFDEEFGDGNGNVWEYIPYEPGRSDPMQIDWSLKDEIMQLIDMNVITQPHNYPHYVLSRISMQHVFYSLMALGWQPVHHPEYPEIRCSICNVNIASSMCSRCNAPICSNTCLVDGHHC